MNKKQPTVGRLKNEMCRQLASPVWSLWSGREDHKSIVFSRMIALGSMAFTMGEFAQGEHIVYDNWNGGEILPSWVPWEGDYDAEILKW